MYEDDRLDICRGNSFVLLEMSRMRRESSGIIFRKLAPEIKTSGESAGGVTDKFKASV